jgi:hypothetical protein
MGILGSKLLAVVWREIDDQNAATLPQQSRGFGECRFGCGNEMQNLMQDNRIGGPVSERQRGNVALPQFASPLSIEFGARKTQHFRTAVDADGMRCRWTEKLNHATRARADIDQATDLLAKNARHALLDRAVGNVERADGVPMLGMLREIAFGRYSAIGADRGKMSRIGNRRIAGGGVEQREQRNRKHGTGRCEENPATLAAARYQSRINENADMARNPRLALSQHLGKFTDRQFDCTQQCEDSQTSRIGKSTENIDNRRHGSLYKEIFICGQRRRAGRAYCQYAGKPITLQPPGDDASGAVAPARIQTGQESHMKKLITFAAVTALAIGVAACSPKAKDESGEAANAMMSDINATAADAVNSVDAATDNAMGSIGSAADAAGNKVESAADKMKAATGAAMEKAGNEVSEAGADVKK